jgi:hypothetical protein
MDQSPVQGESNGLVSLGISLATLITAACHAESSKLPNVGSAWQ